MAVKKKRRKRWNGIRQGTIDLREFMPISVKCMLAILIEKIGKDFAEELEKVSKVPCKEKVKARKCK